MTPDFKEILSIFNEHEVKYLVVGAYAVMKYSEPRYTKDLDIWVEASEGNSQKVYSALKSFGAPLSGLAEADFAFAFYNPRSAARPHQFARTLEILRATCGPARLITFARAVTTAAEHIATVTLADATPEMADMRTIVLVGNSATRRVGRYVYTPRRAG